MPLNGFHFRAGRKLFEDLIDVDFHRIGNKAIVPEDGPQGFMTGQFFYQLLRYALIKTGDQVMKS